MRLQKCICATLFLLLGAAVAGAADDLTIVLLDSRTGHALHRKLVCIAYPAGNPAEPVIQTVHECHRTDSGGSAAFRLPEPAPEKVDVLLASDGLVPCFSPRSFVVADAMKMGVVATNTCGDTTTDTTQTGELVLYGHQKSLWEALNDWHDEF